MQLRSHCPVNYALEHIGDKWVLLILRDIIFKGFRHYNDFLKGGEGISTSVLSNRLSLLEESGILRKGEDPVKKSRILYSLTPKGISLLPVLIELIRWSGKHDEETIASPAFLEQADKNTESLIQRLSQNLEAVHLK